MIIFTICIILLMIMAFVGNIATIYIIFSSTIYIMFGHRRKFEKLALIVHIISALICQGTTIAFSVLVLFVW